VVCDPTEAEHAIAWGRAHPAWADDATPLYALHSERDDIRWRATRLTTRAG
jgi:hypothetical protein